MSREEVFERLTAIFRDVFDDKRIIIEDATTANDIEDWDSFAQIELICAIEDEFSLKMSMETIADLKNVGEMVNVILKYKNSDI